MYIMTPWRRLFVIFNTLALILLAFITLYPFLYVLAASFSSQTAIMQGKVSILPVGFNLNAYLSVIQYPYIPRSYLNTLVYTVASTAFSMFLIICAAYPLSRDRFPGKRFFSLMVTFTMLFSGGMIPTFLVLKNMGFYNNPLVLIIPFAMNSWYVILLRTYMQGIPSSIEESALIDGANEIQILIKIILPLSLPSLMTLTLFCAVASWNAFFTAMIYLTDRDFWPLQLILRQIVIMNEADVLLTGADSGREPISETIKYATIIVATVPILCVYPFIQKYFVTGITVGAVKG